MRSCASLSRTKLREAELTPGMGCFLAGGAFYCPHACGGLLGIMKLRDMFLKCTYLDSCRSTTFALSPAPSRGA